MKFRTEINIQKADFEINHNSKILFLGSCFTENMGHELERLKFNVDINPFGILYNPLSVTSSLEHLITSKLFTESDLIQNNELWHSFSHHSRFSGLDKKETLTNINERLSYSSEFLRQAEYIFITFGTAWVYFLKDTNKVVSNCHKFPDSIFERKLLEVEDVISETQLFIDKLAAINPQLKIIFTVSPVRHWKDGANGNQISKATLILAIEKLRKTNTLVFYFPSYELVLDDLRDYRFFANDMLHPNELAIKYIFEKFARTYFSEETTNLNKEIETVLTAQTHRAFNPNSEAHQKFLRKLELKILDLHAKGIKFDK